MSEDTRLRAIPGPRTHDHAARDEYDVWAERDAQRRQNRAAIDETAFLLGLSFAVVFWIACAIVMLLIGLALAGLPIMPLPRSSTRAT